MNERFYHGLQKLYSRRAHPTPAFGSATLARKTFLSLDDIVLDTAGSIAFWFNLRPHNCLPTTHSRCIVGLSPAT